MCPLQLTRKDAVTEWRCEVLRQLRAMDTSAEATQERQCKIMYSVFKGEKLESCVPQPCDKYLCNRDNTIKKPKQNNGDR